MDAEYWWREYFSTEWWSAIQDEFFGERTTAEVDFLVSALGIAPGENILDVPCGAGRHAIELASRGFQVTGVDVTPGVLEIARTRGREKGVEARWIQGDMRELSFQEEFDAAFCWWGSFGYFSDADNERFLAGVASALKPGGRFAMDTQCAESLLPRFQPRGWSAYGGEILVLEERSYELETGRVDSVWTGIRGDIQKTVRSSIRIYTYREIQEMLLRAGFNTCRGFDPTTGGPFRIGSARLAIVAEK